MLITVLLLAVRGLFSMPSRTQPELVARMAVTGTMIGNWSALCLGWQLLDERRSTEVRARRVAMPPLMVQPLVENAIKYGGRTSPKPLRVHVAARRDGDWLTVEVANTGRWMLAGEAESTGTGLVSLERRLQALIVDDEPGATERLTHLLGEFPEVAVIGTANDVGDAARLLAARTPRPCS